MYAAAEKNLPIICPGWEDSTMGNIFASYVLKGELKASTMKSGIEYMTFLANWYTGNSESGIGFFQIGGGIAGDFPICVVPMLYQDMERKDTPFWSYFCQISDSTTSYGSYSGAVPNEKITWGKLDINTPKFIIESDATIVAPLIFCLFVRHVIMKRVIVDYEKLNTDILDLLVEKYPDGYDYSDIISFQNSEGKTISKVEVRTDTTVYLVKISSKLEQTLEDYQEDDSSFDDLENLDDNF